MQANSKYQLRNQLFEKKKLIEGDLDGILQENISIEAFDRLYPEEEEIRMKLLSLQNLRKSKSLNRSFDKSFSRESNPNHSFRSESQ